MKKKTRRQAASTPKKATKKAVPPPKIPEQELYSINALSEELGIDRRTLKKHLSHIAPARVDGKSKLYRIEDARGVMDGAITNKESFAALKSLQLEEQTRESRARADILELEREEKKKELVPLAAVQAMIGEAFVPIQQRFRAAAAELCTRVNPTDPQFARAAIQQWVDESMRLIRGQLPQPSLPSPQ